MKLTQLDPTMIVAPAPQEPGVSDGPPQPAAGDRRETNDLDALLDSALHSLDCSQYLAANRQHGGQ